MQDNIRIAEGLAKARDCDDFDTAACYLSERCVYDSPKGVVKGREEIIDAYRAASTWPHATFDEVLYESQVERRLATRQLSSSSILIASERVNSGTRTDVVRFSRWNCCHFASARRWRGRAVERLFRRL